MRALLITTADIGILAACGWAINLIAGNQVVTAGVFAAWISAIALFKANDNESEGEDL